MRASTWLVVAACLLGLGSHACLNRSDYTSGEKKPTPSPQPPASSVSAAYSRLTADVNFAVADGVGAIQLSVNVRNMLGDPMPNMVVVFSADGNGNVFSPTTGTTDANGVVQSTLTSTFAQGETIFANVGNVTLKASVTFVAGAVDAFHSTITASPNVVTADDVSESVLKLSLADAHDNAVRDQAVTLTVSGSNNVLRSITPGNMTDHNGIYTVALASSFAETKTVTATAGAFVQQANVVFGAAAPSGSHSIIIANPNQVTTDNNTTLALKATVVDASANPVPNTPINLTGGGSQNVFSPAGGVTDASGTFASTLYSPLAQSENIIATGSNFSVQTPVTFVPGAAAASNSSLAAAPTSLVADGSSVMTLTLAVEDAQGNRVPNAAVSFSVDGTGNAFPQGLSGATDATGAFSITMRSTKAEPKNVSATSGGVVKSATVTFTAGAPSSTLSSIVASPNSVSTDAPNKSNLTVTLRDAFGNLVADGTAVSFSGSGTTNTFVSINTSTSAGVATGTVSATLAQSENVLAMGTGYSVFATITFTAGVPVSANSTIAASPNQVVANNANFTSVTFTAIDAHNNAVPNQAVTFTSSNGNDTFTPSATCSTNGAGICNANMVSKVAEVKTITGLTGTASRAATVTFVGGSPNSTLSSIVAAPTKVVADNVSQSSILVTLKDGFGNLASPTLITMGSSGGNDTFTPPSGTSNNGTFTFSMKSKTAQVKTVTATEATASESANITFTAGSPALATSSLVITGSPVLANGVASETVTVTLRDQYGNLAPSWPFTLSAMNTASPQLSQAAQSNASGVFTFALTSQFAGAKLVTAQVGAVKLSGTATFNQPTSYCSNANGAFYGTPPTWRGLSTSTHMLTTVDLNLDGFTDIVESDGGNNAVAVGLGLGNGRFQKAVSYPVGNNPTMVATCRLNADTYPDVVVVNATDGTFTAFLGSSTGALTVTPSSPVTASGANMLQGSIQCADITNDGLADVLVSSFASPRRFYYFAGNGSGGFAAPTTQNVTSPAYYFVLGDVNGDSNQDIVYVDDANHVELNISKGGGTFAAQVGKSVGLGTNPMVVALADLDGKNGIDIVTANYGTNNASILLNNGSGTFPTSTFVTVGATSPSSLALADLNGDGNVEIIVGSGPDDNITITPGLGNAIFGTPKAFAAGSAPNSISVAKVDSGTTLDLVIALGANGVGGAQVLFGNGDATVKDNAIYPAGNSPAGLAAGDLNGDGYADLVATCSSEVDVFINSGTGGVFNAYVPYTTAVNAQAPVSVSLIDLDSDGDLDVVSSLTGSSGGMLTMFNAGNGTLTGGVSYTTPPGNDWGAAVADYNGDGHPDVAWGSRSGGNVWVALGSATGALGTPHSTPVGSATSNPAEMAAGDVNGDGNQDLVVALYGDDEVGVLLGAGDGNFVDHGSYASLSGGGGLGGVGLADLNLDGKIDVAVTETIGFSSGTLLGDGTGALTGKWGDADDFPFAVTIADINGDGVPDMLVSANYAHTVDVHIGNGDGTMTPQILYPSGHHPYYMAVADFDHDGHMDIANTDQGDNTMSVRLWTACP